MNSQRQICHCITSPIEYFLGSRSPLYAIQTAYNEAITIETPGWNSGGVWVKEWLDVSDLQSRRCKRDLPLLHCAKRLVMTPGFRVLWRIFKKEELSLGSKIRLKPLELVFEFLVNHNGIKDRY